jgi:hypothetical protein
MEQESHLNSMGPPSTRPTLSMGPSLPGSKATLTEMGPPSMEQVLAQGTSGCYRLYCCWCKTARAVKDVKIGDVKIGVTTHYACAGHACAAASNLQCSAFRVPWYEDPKGMLYKIGANGEPVAMLRWNSSIVRPRARRTHEG